MFERMQEAFGRLDICVPNSAIQLNAPVDEMTLEQWQGVIDVNLKSVVFCSQIVASSMVERKRGAIVNVASIAGRNGGGPGAAAYSTAKGGLITFTKSLAKEMAAHGVRVNAVSPGVIDTPFHEMFSTPEMIRNFVTSIPLGRTGTAMECATVIAFLASEASGYVIGETIEVNGGQLML